MTRVCWLAVFGANPLLIVSTTDPLKPKPAPPPPTPLSFPFNRKYGPSSHAVDAKFTLLDLQRLFQIKRLMDITPHHFNAMNLQSRSSVPLEDLVHERFLPPQAWEEEPAMNHSEDQSASTQVSSDTLSNGAAIPSHEFYYIRKKELLLDKAEVYQYLQNRPSKNVKVVHFRKFWTFLRQVGEYWDASIDRYFDDDAVDGPTQSTIINGTTDSNTNSDNGSDLPQCSDISI